MDKNKTTVDFREGETIWKKDITRPAFMFNIKGKVIASFGEYTEVKKLYDIFRGSYHKEKLPTNAMDFVFVEVPPNQELVDKLFNSEQSLYEYIINVKEELQL